MNGWKSIGFITLLTLSSLIGVVTMYGSDVATGTTVSGHISIDTTWDLSGSPYIVINDVVVDFGITLTVEPGVEVKFDPPGMHGYLSIFVEGNLFAVGQADKPINFTSNAPIPDYEWDRVQINSTGTSSIENCTFSYGEGLDLASTTPHGITQNNFHHSAKLIVQTPGHLLENNEFDNKSGIWLGSGNNDVRENSLIDSTIWLVSGNNNISSNTIVNGYRGIVAGILIESGANGNSIVGNSLSNLTSGAIEVRSSYNTLSLNSIKSCDSGIDVSPPNNTISLNEISDCLVGISIGSNDNRVLGNRIDEGSDGIIISNGDRNVVAGNEIRSVTSYGVYLVSGSTQNAIYHNILIDNAVQAKDDIDTNLWDNGYPSGGNFWSDYLGSDSFWGINQDIPGSDGIGDSSYLITTNGTDRYPLTDPTIVGLPPRNVNAHLSGASFGNVTITWNLSWNDGQRANDVSGYEIYRSTGYDKERLGYSLHASTPNQTMEFVDILSGDGDPNNYFYFACAVNGTANRSCSSNQVGKFTHQLLEGPNLVSIPLVQSDEDVAVVLQTASFDDVWLYDSQLQEWTSSVKSKPYSKGFPQLNHTVGFWVNVTSDSNLTVAGIVDEEISIRLYPGWNLVGFPSFTAVSLAAVQQEVPVERAERSSTGSDPYHLKAMNSGDMFLPGEGYWLLLSTECIFELRN